MIGCAQLSLRLGKLGRVDEHGRVQPDDMDLDARFARRGKPWCANLDGYSLHAGITVRGDDDVGRENLCRYVLRHPISLSCLSLTSDGRVAYQMKYPRGKKTHLLMDPVQFLARLASLVPPPRHPLVRYVGVLSSASRWRDHVVPKPEDSKHPQARPSEAQPPTVTKTTDVSSTLAGTSEAAEPEAQQTYRGSVAAAGTYVDWATLLRRVFSVDALACAKCGGRLRFIATITEQPAVTKILDSLGLASSPPLPHARAPDPQRARAVRGVAARADGSGVFAAGKRGHASVRLGFLSPHGWLLVPSSLNDRTNDRGHRGHALCRGLSVIPNVVGCAGLLVRTTRRNRHARVRAHDAEGVAPRIEAIAVRRHRVIAYEILVPGADVDALVRLPDRDRVRERLSLRLRALDERAPGEFEKLTARGGLAEGAPRVRSYGRIGGRRICTTRGFGGRRPVDHIRRVRCRRVRTASERF